MLWLIMLLSCMAVALALYEFLLRRCSKQNRQKIVQRILPEQGAAKSGRNDSSGLLKNKLNQHLKQVPLIGKSIAAQEAQRFSASCEAEIPRMLEILALGMKAGLGFDAAMGLYVRRFNTTLANCCLESFEVWERGLISREAGLRTLASKIDLPIFSRFASTAIRALNYGAPMAPLLRDYASEARKIYRDKQREMVAKAPVKMLIPTGALILPAMLMLVIGPIVLDVTERMV